MAWSIPVFQGVSATIEGLMKIIAKEIDKLLPLVKKPAQYVGGERGMIQKEPTGSQLKVALVFPDLYEIGMSHIGLKILYHILNKLEYVAAERFYAPMPDMEELLVAENLPLFSIENKIPLNEFDIIGITLQTELNYSTVLHMLRLGHVPIRCKERKSNDPVVLGGGPCTVNPEPLVDFIDLFLVGDGEEAIVEIAETAKKVIDSEPETEIRKYLLASISRIKGIYNPAILNNDGTHIPLDGQSNEEIASTGRIRRRWIKNMRPEWTPVNPLVPITEVVQDRMTVEIQRGCTRGCRFCQAGYISRPVRELQPDDVVSLAQRGLAFSGWHEVGLVSLSTSDYSQISELTRKLSASPVMNHVSTSYPSLRADSFSIDLAAEASRVKRTGLTFAPEAGTYELRKRINKPISDEELFEAITHAFDRGWKLIKLYFMIGLPSERWSDIEGLVDLSYRLGRLAKARGGGRKITMSIGVFVPKPHTPFQWEPFAGLSEIKEKLDYLKKKITAKNVKLKWQEPLPAFVEAYLARGDRSAGRVLERAWSLGAVLDSWSSSFNKDAWLTALKEVDIEPSLPLPGPGLNEKLPWEIIDVGVDKSFLLRELEKFHKETLTPDCRNGICSVCGLEGCTMPAAVRRKKKKSLSTDSIVEESSHLDSGNSEYPEDDRMGDLKEVVFSEGNKTETKGKRLKAQSAGKWGRRKRSVNIRQKLGLHIRVKYARKGAVKYLSHLDLTRCWTRMLRMSGLPVLYTSGFTPRPRVDYGPPAPVGISSITELIDFDLERLPSVDIASSLKAVTLPGIEILSVHSRNPQDNSLSARIFSALYKLTIPSTIFKNRLDLEKLIDDFRNLDELIHEYSRGANKIKRVDLVRAVIDLELLENDNVILSDAFTLGMKLRIGDPTGNNTNPSTVLQVVFRLGKREVACIDVERMAFFDKWGGIVE